MSVSAQELEILSTKAIAAKGTAYCMTPTPTELQFLTLKAPTPNSKSEHAFSPPRASSSSVRMSRMPPIPWEPVLSASPLELPW